MTKITVLFAGLLALAACQTAGDGGFNQFDNQVSPVEEIAAPTDGIARDDPST